MRRLRSWFQRNTKTPWLPTALLLLLGGGMAWVQWRQRLDQRLLEAILFQKHLLA